MNQLHQNRQSIAIKDTKYTSNWKRVSLVAISSVRYYSVRKNTSMSLDRVSGNAMISVFGSQ